MKNGRFKYDRKMVILLLIEFFLILVLLGVGVQYMRLENKLRNLENTAAKTDSKIADSSKTPAAYKEPTINKELRSSKAIDLVETFLKTYYESNSTSSYEKIVDCEKYLSDDALRQLCPYDNDPTEISDELIKKIRAHDPSFLNAEQSSSKNFIGNMDVFYRGDSGSKEQVLVYFTLETVKKNSNHSNKTVYLFKCTLGDPNGDLLITDIDLKTPVILPSYDPDAAITY